MNKGSLTLPFFYKHPRNWTPPPETGPAVGYKLLHALTRLWGRNLDPRTFQVHA
jgi:hypothetical protein